MGQINIPIQVPEPAFKKGKCFVLFVLGFRPFFLAAGIFSVLLMVTFILGVQTGIWHYNYFPLPLWHAHEMLFGYTAAVIAGFLLTAVRNWTGMDTATGNSLLALLLLWLGGRLISAVPGVSEWLIILIDMAFLPVLALVVARPIVKARQMRNLSVPGLLLLMAAGNGLLYAEMLGLSDGMNGLWLSVAVVLMLISLIAGRIMLFLPGGLFLKPPFESILWLSRWHVL